MLFYCHAVVLWRCVVPVLVVSSHKGGTGKTATAVNLAASLTRFGDVLAVDMDPQATMSEHLRAVAPVGEPTVDDLLREDPVPVESVIRGSSVPRLSVLPADIALTEAEKRMMLEDGGEFYLKEALAGLDEVFAWTVIDTAPSLGRLTLSGILAADAAIGVALLDPDSIKGVLRSAALVNRQRERGRTRAQFAGVVVNRVERPLTNHARASLAQLESLPLHVYDEHILKRVRITEARTYQVPATHLDPNSYVTESYDKLADEVISTVAAPALAVGQ